MNVNELYNTLYEQRRIRFACPDQATFYAVRSQLHRKQAILHTLLDKQDRLHSSFEDGIAAFWFSPALPAIDFQLLPEDNSQ